MASDGEPGSPALVAASGDSASKIQGTASHFRPEVLLLASCEKLLCADERPDAFLAQRKRIIGAQHHSIRSHRPHQKLQRALIKHRRVDEKRLR